MLQKLLLILSLALILLAFVLTYADVEGFGAAIYGEPASDAVPLPAEQRPVLARAPQ